MVDGLTKSLTEFRDFLWGPPLVVLLLGTGIYFMVLLRGLPVRKLFWAIGLSIGAAKGDGERKGSGITAFSSLATELAATIGIGNVIGVVTAMTIGGPGALTWMMLSALAGLSTKLVESTMSVHFRIKRDDGSYLGGPMVSLSTAFPNRRLGKLLGFCYAIFVILCCIGMGNMVQSNSIALTLKNAVGWKQSAIGIAIACCTLFSVLGGIKIVSKVSEWLVPFMGILYVLGCLGIILRFPGNLIPALQGMIVGLFCPRAACGGVFGYVTANWIQSMRIGMARGIFSNEAGLGAGGISAAATNEKNAVRQGWISMSAIFYDTLLICFLTGLAYSCSGVASVETDGNGARRILMAFEGTYGRFGVILLSACITLFAFATILGWAVQGEGAFGFLFGEEKVKWFRLSYAFFTLAGAVCTLDTVWTISDIANGLLAIPNLILLWVMGPEICKIILRDPDGKR